MALRTAVTRHFVTLVLLLLFVSACGASARTKTLRVNLVALNAARDTTLTVSKAHEKQLVDGCNPPNCTKEEGHAQLDAWRAKVDVVIKALDVAYGAIHDAALLDDAKSASSAGAAAVKALALFKELPK
jgi:hypothetical protein